MSATAIAAALGDAKREGRDWRCSCPLHGGCSLTLSDGRERLLVRRWAGCETNQVLAGLRGLIAGLDRRRWRAAVMTAPTLRSASHGRGASGMRPGTRAGALAGSGIALTLPPLLRGMPPLRRPDASDAPAKVGRVASLDGESIGVHRTWLDRDPGGTGRRRDRASLGPSKGGTVRLGKLRSGASLIVAEGIESAPAVAELSGWPAWAALSAGGVERLILPPVACDVVIAVDCDRCGIGEREARTAGQRSLAETGAPGRQRFDRR